MYLLFARFIDYGDPVEISCCNESRN